MIRSVGCFEAKQCEERKRVSSGNPAKGTGVLKGPRKNCMTASQARTGETLEQSGTMGVGEKLSDGTSPALRQLTTV